MRGFLLDTHIWWWYLTNPARLPKGDQERIDDALDRIWLSPISVWEAGMLVKKGKLTIPVEFRQWVDQAMSNFPVNEASVNREIAVLSGELALPHKDPADRFIAASTLVYEMTLLTADERLLAAEWLPT